MVDVGGNESVPIDRVVAIESHRERFARRPYAAGYPNVCAASAQHIFVGRLACDRGCGKVDFGYMVLQTIVGKRYGIGVERVCFDNIDTGFKIAFVDGANTGGIGKTKDVVAAFERTRPIGETLTSEVGFAELVALNHSPHRSVESECASVDRFDKRK